MIILYIVLGLVVCAGIGKIAAHSSDKSVQVYGSPFRPNRRTGRSSIATIDPEENPRAMNDGTDYGYKEFD
jgi:hypothetical protein